MTLLTVMQVEIGIKVISRRFVKEIIKFEKSFSFVFYFYDLAIPSTLRTTPVI